MRDRSLPLPPLAKCNLSMRQIAKNAAQNTTFLKTADRSGKIACKIALLEKCGDDPSSFTSDFEDVIFF